MTDFPHLCKSETRVSRSSIRRRLVAASLPASALLLAGCGGAGQTAPSPIAAPAPTPAPTPSPAPTPTPTPVDSFNTAEYRRSDGANYHDANTAWAAGASGTGVTVAVIDSGVDADSPEFTGRIHPMSADVAGGARGFDEAGSDGHGTNVAQLLLGARNDTGTVGIAWNATLLALRADRPGSCTDTTSTTPDERGCRFTDAAIAAGVDRAVSAGAKVINISLGGSTPAQILIDSVSRATASGVIIIVAAGNDGDSTDSADDPNNPDPFAQGLLQAGNGLVIIAGSNNETGQISAFSNRAGNGAANYLLALGERVCCDYENGDLRREVTDDGSFVFVISGTSYSAPQVAGAAALLAQAFPNLSGRQIVDLLLTTATDVGPIGTDSVNGRGILNIPRAFAPQGVTTLAGTSVALPLDRMMGGYSAAMGDAALRTSTPAVVLDGYQRAYAVGLNRIMQPLSLRQSVLLSGLVGQGRSVSGGNAQMAVSLAVQPGQWTPSLMPVAAAGADAARARLLAGTVMIRVSRAASFGIAVERGAQGLSAMLAGRSGGAFLVAEGASANRMTGMRGSAGTALRLAVAPDIALSMTAERGSVAAIFPGQRLADPTGLDRPAAYNRLGLAIDHRRTVGRVGWDGGIGASILTERDSVLGARWSALLGQSGSRTLFVDGAARIDLDRRWHIGAEWREGWTQTSGAGLIGGGSMVRTRAWAVDIGRVGLLVANDQLALRLAKPLRVESGGLMINAPIGYDYVTQLATTGRILLPLTPVGREHVIEAVWSAPAFGGRLTLNSFWRDQPGHIAAAPDDLGAAVRFNLGF